MNQINICKECGKEITTEGRSKFCSAGCQSAFYGENKKEKLKYKEAKKRVNFHLKLMIKRICKCCSNTGIPKQVSNDILVH